MKQFVIAGTVAGALTLAGAALAQQPAQPPPPPPQPRTATPTTGTTGAQDPAKPAQPRATRRGSQGEAAGHAAPKEQPNTAEEPSAPSAMVLGTVRIPKGLKADGKDLPAGSYQVRLTADEAKPDAKGASEQLERWVEFVKGGNVVAREVVTIVPANEVKLVQKDAPPRAGASKVETLKGGDYVRVWINKGGTHYLVHLPNS
jgi:hypothetical protein